MKILITNDDGYDAYGIRMLTEAAREFGDVTVVAPRRQSSAASHHVTFHRPMEIEHAAEPLVPGTDLYILDGTPADCVRASFLGALPFCPDAVLSGMNCGANTGYDIQYSATIGAGMEGLLYNVPVICFSELQPGRVPAAQACGGSSDGPAAPSDHPAEPDELADDTSDQPAADLAEDPAADPEYLADPHATAREYMPRLIQELLFRRTAPDHSLWNVNFPACSPAACQGVLYGRRLSQQALFDDHYLPGGKRICALVAAGTKAEITLSTMKQTYAEPGSDMRAIFDNYVSVGTVRNTALI